MSRLMIVSLIAVVFAIAGPGALVFGDESNAPGERDLKVAEFYDRTGQTGSASFYYELVQRRHPGTAFAQKASQRIEVLKQATRDYDVAEFYHRAGHAASANFYYELVVRRYPGTTFAMKAKERIEQPQK